MNKRKGAKEMKTLRIYQITKQQAENTEYRPLDVEIEEIETEDGWNYADVIENDGDGYQAEKITETRDGLIVWRRSFSMLNCRRRERRNMYSFTLTIAKS